MKHILSCLEAAMYSRFGKVLLMLAFAFSCLTFSQARAQGQNPSPHQGPGPHQEEREGEHMREGREGQHMREGQGHERQEWNREEWHRHNQRFFGGIIIEQNPYESYDEYVARIHVQCNVQWSNCATYCNTIPDPYQRAACVANCNNEINECNYGY